MNMIYRQENLTNRRETFIYLGNRGKEFHQLIKKSMKFLWKILFQSKLNRVKNILDTLNKIVGNKNQID